MPVLSLRLILCARNLNRTVNKAAARWFENILEMPVECLKYTRYRRTETDKFKDNVDNFGQLFMAVNADRNRQPAN